MVKMAHKKNENEFYDLYEKVCFSKTLCFAQAS